MKNATHNITIISDNHFFTYGLWSMISRLEIACDKHHGTSPHSNIIFRKTMVSINYHPSQTEKCKMVALTVNIPFICNSLNLSEVQAKLEKIILLSRVSPYSSNKEEFYQKIGTKRYQQLSTMENQVLRYLGKGCCAQVISSQLGCTAKTVSQHCRSAMRKMGLSKKSELYHYAYRTSHNADREHITLCL